MSLHLERRIGQSIIIDGERRIEVTLGDFNLTTGKAYFFIKAPKDVRIIRKELLQCDHQPTVRKVHSKIAEGLY